MSNDNDWADECYFCYTCNKAYRSPNFTISRGFERTIFFDGDRIPEIEPIGVEVLEGYCSQSCLDARRDEVLKQEGVRITFPGIGPIESCSRCGGPVDMARLHRAWTEDQSIEEWGAHISIAQVVNAQTLAVACQKCAPPPSSRRAKEKEIDDSRIADQHPERAPDETT